MKKFSIPIILGLTLGIFLITLMATRASPNQPPGLPLSDVEIITSRHARDGTTSTSLLSIFGPHVCTLFGDPFSPLNSTWAPGPYTYTYRIDIPADYPHDILRVEIFDPDSINSANNSATVLHTDIAINAGGLAATVSGSCANSNRKNPCYIDTNETTNGSPISGLEFDQVNPLWYMRVDHNRGGGTPPGNGLCIEPGSYNESFNTATRFELYYYQDDNDPDSRTSLTAYTGQTGLEATNHETDLHWVSPGAEISFAWDKDAPGVDVPADADSQTANGFEIDLTTEIPNILVDPDTGERHIYIDVTALSGSSNNSFEFWAGPPTYVNSVPSHVNDRNIFVRNNFASYTSRGVNIFALGYLPQQSNIEFRVERPLINLTPEQAGESIYVSLFDADTLAQPPITFYLDTIPPEDWSLTFGADDMDPDGITSTVRCQLANMGCNNQWIDPPYEIKLPSGTKDCDFSNPTAEACTPFYGGRLMANHQGGQADTYGWQISISENEPADPTTGCDAFPIAIHEGVRSVNQASYPTSGYPTAPPIPPYSSFIHHVDSRPLLQATEGTVYKIYNGIFGWLLWNPGISNSSNTLADSLAWPGNTNDYTDHGDPGQPIPGSGFPHVVRGYVEPGDPTDQQLQIGDWIASSTGGINAADVRNVLNEHITPGRVLRLPVWNDSQGSGSTGAYRASGFALFHIHGYNVTGGADSWLLLEFIRWDTSCGQPGQPPEPVTAVSSITIDGTTYTAPNVNETFTANILPLTATQPVSYTWEATDFAPVTHNSNISDTITFNWATIGSKTITVTAQNAGGSVTATHTLTVSDLVRGKDLTIIGAPKLITPLPINEGDPVTFEVTVKNIGTEDIASHWFVNLFVNPGTINPDGIPAAESVAFTTLSALDSGESKTVSITLNDGLPMPNTHHLIYAMVDTFKTISEVNETNNISESLPFGANNFIEWRYLYLPIILKP